MCWQALTSDAVDLADFGWKTSVLESFQAKLKSQAQKGSVF